MRIAHKLQKYDKRFIKRLINCLKIFQKFIQGFLGLIFVIPDSECLGEEFGKGPIVGDWFTIERCGEKKCRLKVESNDGGKRHLVLEVRSRVFTDTATVTQCGRNK